MCSSGIVYKGQVFFLVAVALSLLLVCLFFISFYDIALDFLWVEGFTHMHTLSLSFSCEHKVCCFIMSASRLPMLLPCAP